MVAGALAGGRSWSRVDATVDTGSPVLPSINQTTAGMRAALFVDQTDHAFFPTRGAGAAATGYAALASFGSAVSYQRLEESVRAATSLGRHTLLASAAAGTDLGSDMPAYESFSLGGPARLSGYRINQFSGRRYTYGRLMYYNRVLRLPDILGSGIYLGGGAEVGRITDRIDGLTSPGTLWSGSIFLGADTFLGPMYAGFGLGESGSWTLYFLLGAP